MTERQQKTLEKMHPDRWYTARSLETNELSLDGLRKKKLVKRRQGQQYTTGGYTLNMRWEYQKI
jgi:hypothetical protein